MPPLLRRFSALPMLLVPSGTSPWGQATTRHSLTVALRDPGRALPTHLGTAGAPTWVVRHLLLPGAVPDALAVAGAAAAHGRGTGAPAGAPGSGGPTCTAV